MLAYTALLGLDTVRSDQAAAQLVADIRDQHADHASAFNAAAVRVGGAPQVEPDPRVLATLRARHPGVRTVTAALALAASVEDIAVATYTAAVLATAVPALRTLFGSVSGVEAQHGAVLRTLLSVGTQAPLTSTRNLAGLPAAAGSAGVPDAFATTAAALTPAPEASS